MRFSFQKSKRSVCIRPSFLNVNRSADGHNAQQIFRVPVGEAEAAVGFGAADVFGSRGSVDAVAGTVKADPRDTDGIIQPRR